MRLHIDGDIIRYRCGFAAESGEYTLVYGGEFVEKYKYKKDLEQRITNLGLNDKDHPQGRGDYEVSFIRTPEPVENALHNVKTLINSITESAQSNDCIVYLSGSTNFRNEIATIKEYKGNRDKAHKPVHGPAINEFLENNYNCVVSDNEEADDVIGYTHYAMWKDDPDSTMICSTDKDLDMIPGLHYNFVREEVYNVGEEQAERVFYTQLLTGDTVDNIPGVKGVGPKTAEKILANCTNSQSMYKAVLATYEKVSGEYGWSDLVENANLLWIRREPNQIWEPPN